MLRQISTAVTIPIYVATAVYDHFLLIVITVTSSFRLPLMSSIESSLKCDLSRTYGITMKSAGWPVVLKSMRKASLNQGGCTKTFTER